jgi:hypothetical protein
MLQYPDLIDCSDGQSLGLDNGGIFGLILTFATNGTIGKAERTEEGEKFGSIAIDENENIGY